MSIRLNQTMATTAEAARKLSVSQRRVQQMVADGALESVSSDARSYLIPVPELRRARLRSGKVGRPYSPSHALASLYLLSDLPASWIGAQQRYRIKNSLLNTRTAEELVHRVCNRARTEEYWCAAHHLEELRHSLALSGISSPYRDSFQLFESTAVEGYLSESNLAELVRRHRLDSDAPTANVQLHIVEPSLWEKMRAAEEVPLAVCAADLAESVDLRESRAGLSVLEELLLQYQSEQGVMHGESDS
ncbi:DNA-binding domain, excisionase family [Bifidobacterium animalis subsp. animalis]|nr:DNA-binding domain, excisionase family [Bifidobacterium animalis subsp. animalis]